MEYTKDYLDYLESEHWKALRAESFVRAGGKCEACSSKKKLQGHHLKYAKPMTDGVPADIMALCEICHDKWHEWLRLHGYRLGQFNRDSTKGAIMVLRTVPGLVSAPRLEYIPLPKKILPHKETKAERKAKRRAERMEKQKLKREAAAKAKAALKEERLTAFQNGEIKMERRERHFKALIVQRSLTQEKAFQNILLENSQHTPFKKAVRDLFRGRERFSSLMANAFVLFGKREETIQKFSQPSLLS